MRVSDAVLRVLRMYDQFESVVRIVDWSCLCDHRVVCLIGHATYTVCDPSHNHDHVVAAAQPHIQR
jgi:hypothetical protein